MLLETAEWPLQRTDEAVDALLLVSGFRAAASARPGVPVREWEDLAWLKRIPPIGCDVQSHALSRSQLLRELATRTGPCLVCNRASQTTLAVVFETAGRARVIRPDGSEAAVRRSHVLNLLRSAGSLPELEAIFAGLKGGRRAARALRDAELDQSDTLLVTFEPDAAHPLRQQLSHGGAFRALAFHLALIVVQGGVTFLALWTLGSAIVDGHVDFGRIAAWSVLSLSAPPLQYLSARALFRFSVVLGARIKRRLLEGSFRIDEREIRQHGYGAILGRANEASIVERADLINVFQAFSSSGQLVIAALFLERSSLFRPLLLMMLGATVALVFLAYRLFRSHANTYRLRLEQTSDMVDKILGHRTRAVQQPASQYHREEDDRLSIYCAAAQDNDNLHTLVSVFPRLWLTVSFVFLLEAFMVRDSGTSLAFAAIGILFAFQGFGGLCGALQNACVWLTAYRGVRPLLEAGSKRDRPPRRESTEAEEPYVPVVLSATSLSFAYRLGGIPILNETSLRIHRGEKVLVTGPSGGGKTTLFKLIGGELRPSGGVILVRGCDAHMVSEEEWRERVASAPQFHENYVFAQPVAFNLDPKGELAAPSAAAREICAELRLDQVIARMPQGYAQLLGETGWQLSHGERSRLYIARALLQGADLFLFDESFGALDPETQLVALECVRNAQRRSW